MPFVVVVVVVGGVAGAIVKIDHQSDLLAEIIVRKRCVTGSALGADIFSREINVSQMAWEWAARDSSGEGLFKKV